MNPKENYLDLYENLSQKVQASLPVISDSLGKNKFKYVTKALLLFIPKSGYLMSSILQACGSNNPYAASILFRSLIEHSFKHLYIFVKALNENSDSVGEIYYKTLKAKEDLDSVQKIINYNKAVYPEKTQRNTQGDHNKNISDEAKQFEIQKIFYYLIANNNSQTGDLVKRYKKEYLLGRLIEYTNMSSSVHGGPFGELALLELKKDKGKFVNTLDKFISDSFLLHKSIIETTYLFAYLMDKTMEKYYNEVKDLNMDIISKIKSLNLPIGKYIVFGSSVMEVHGIRKAKDVDLIVDKDVYKELKRRGWKRHWFFKRVLTCKALKKDGNEAFSHIKWKNYRVENDELFKNAEIIEGVPFMELNEYLRYKRCLPREKDKRDVKLIEAYLASGKVGM